MKIGSRKRILRSLATGILVCVFGVSGFFSIKKYNLTGVSAAAEEVPSGENSEEDEAVVEKLEVLVVQTNEGEKVVENVMFEILGELDEPGEATFETESNLMSWGMGAMGLDTAVAQANAAGKGAGVKIAIIDTGLNVGDANTNNTFKKVFPNRKVAVYDVATNSTSAADAKDLNGHGTHVAGTVTEGTPENVEILGIRVPAKNDGGRNFSLENVVKALEYAKEKGAKVINMSFGAEVTSAETIDYMCGIFDVLAESGIISVAAAGNEGRRVNLYPASCKSVISVTALKQDGDGVSRDASYANYGENVEYAAPGTGIKSINATMSGTSMATPHLTAAVGILKSYNAGLKLSETRGILQNYAKDLGAAGRDEYYGYGMVSFTGVEFCNVNVKCDAKGIFKTGELEKTDVAVENKTGGAATAVLENDTLKVTSEKACVVVAEKTDGSFAGLAGTAVAGGRKFAVAADVVKIYVVLKGDVSMNGKVNVNDSAQINLSLLSTSNKYYKGLTELETIVADVSGNGKINVNDSAMINLALLPSSNKFYTALAW